MRSAIDTTATKSVTYFRKRGRRTRVLTAALRNEGAVLSIGPPSVRGWAIAVHLCRRFPGGCALFLGGYGRRHPSTKRIRKQLTGGRRRPPPAPSPGCGAPDEYAR